MIVNYLLTKVIVFLLQNKFRHLLFTYQIKFETYNNTI